MKNEQSRERRRKLITSNRRARHDYEILQIYEAGIALQGTEVKSLRVGKCSLQESYAGFKSTDDNEIYIFNLHINPYEHGNIANHEPKRPRKLLMSRREINKLKTAVQEKGLTIVPLQIYFSGHLVKIELALVRAKRKYDKREATKERESDREVRRKYGV